MAGTTDPDKAALLAEITATRGELSDATERLREATDVPARVRRSVRQNRTRWVVGASAAALVLVLIARRKKVVYVERSSGEILGAAGKAGMVLTGLKVLASVAKPLLGELAKSRFSDVAARFAKHRPGSGTEPMDHR